MPVPLAVAQSHEKNTHLIQNLFSHEHEEWTAADGFRGVRITGCSREQKEQPATELFRRLRQLYAGIHEGRQEIVYCLSGQGQRVSVSLFAAHDITPVESALRGILEDCGLERLPDNALLVPGGYVGGMTGMPSLPQEGKDGWRDPIPLIARGMQGCNYRVLFRCRPLSPDRLAARRKEMTAWLDDAESNTQFVQPPDHINPMSRTYTVSAAQRYREYLQKMIMHLEDARSTGLWKVACCYTADTPADFQRLTVLLQAAYGTENSGPDPIRCGASDQDGVTLLSGSQVAALCMLPDQEISGFYINDLANFDQTARRQPDGGMKLGSIVRSPYGREDMEPYTFSWQDFDRHALIVGATGGGKTNTVKSILKTLYQEHDIPFLVIESAKSEYWQMSAMTGFEGLCAFPLGHPACDFHLNPFECMANFPLQTHVDSLLSTFNAAFDMYPPMPFLLEQAVYQVYDDYGWDITYGKNRYGRTSWPTLSDLHEEIARTVENSSYDQEIKSNVIGALQTRVRSLMIGGKGRMMDVAESTDFRALLKSQVVMELENLGNDNTKTFVMGLLMNRLYEYRRANMPSGRISMPFSHLLIIEEAHRLLKNVAQDGENQSRAASVEFFCNMLAEIRSYGQGIMIADQSPTKLARDAIRNTNLKIVHRIVDREDREAVGSAMHMTEDQINALSVFKRGVGAVYAEGDHRPLLVHFPLIESKNEMNRQRTILNANRLSGTSEGEIDLCLLCPRRENGICRAPGIQKEAERLRNRLVREQGADWVQTTLRQNYTSVQSVFSLMEAAAALDQGCEYDVDTSLTDKWPQEQLFCLSKKILELGINDRSAIAQQLSRINNWLLNSARR